LEILFDLSPFMFYELSHKNIAAPTDAVAKDSPWIFGLGPSSLSEFLKTFHLVLIADVGNADYQEKYLKPIGRKLVVSEGERIVQAVVK
jgi:O-methyltransferase involved in polyketide biosynthesis